MKLLLKSIAFFASLALLCTSCAEDETSDVNVDPTTTTVVASSTIDGAIAGNGKVVLDLSVPIDDNIRSYTISWTGARTSSKNVTIAELYAYEGTDKVTIYEKEGYIAVKDTLSLVAGDYNFSVDNIVKSSCESATYSLDDAINVYDASIYTTHPVEYSVAYTDEGDLKITWGEIPKDFLYMTISHEIESSLASTSFTTTGKIYPDTETTYGYVKEDETVTIPDVKRDTEYQFTSYFRPSTAIDSDSENVALTDEESTRVVPQNTLAETAPQSVSVQPGNGRIKVTWSLPYDEEAEQYMAITNTKIQIYDSEGVNTVGSEIVITELSDEGNVVYINDDGETDAAIETLAAADYVVKMWNTYDGGTIDSEHQEHELTVYSSVSYSDAAPIPVVAYGGNVLVSWQADSNGTDISYYKNSTYYSELQSVLIEYNGYSESLVKTGLSGFSEFTYTDGIKAITYTYTYLPTGGADEIAVVNNGSLPNSASDADLDWNGSYTTKTKFEGSLKSSATRAQIKSAKGLKAFADLVNGNSNTAGAIVSANLLAQAGFGRTNTGLAAYIDSSLAENGLDMSAYSWQSVGSYAAPYVEDFDGNSVPIKGISMRSNATDRQGFFGSLVGDGGSGGKLMIENIKLVDPIIEGWDLSNVGGIAGYASRVEFHNCHLVAETTGSPKGHVKIATEKAEAEKTYLGGIVGRFAGSSHYSEMSIILNCSNEMPVYNETGGDAVGGLAGHVNEAYIINSYNTGNITASSVNSPANYGGIVGHIPSGCQDFQIIGCYNTGDISGAASYVGGIVGWVQAITSGDYVRIAACFNTGTIVNTGEFIGGVVGGLRAETYLYNLVGCYNYGPLYSSYQGTNGHAGGVVGGVGYGESDELGTYAVDAYSESYFIYNDYLAVEEANPVLWAIGTNSTHIDKASSVNVGLDIDDSSQAAEDIESSSTLTKLNSTYRKTMNTALKAFYESNESISLNGSSVNYGTDIKDKSEYWYGFAAGTNIDTDHPTLTLISSLAATDFE